MSYDNPQVPHEVNVSQESQVFSFVKLLGAIILLFVLGFVAIYFIIRVSMQFVPFEFETAISEDIANSFISQSITQDKPHQQAQIRLQQLAENLSAQMDAPADMPIRVHLISERMPNAFATLGGNIIITQGLLDEIHSENALAMVMAHELGHIKNRDPITALGTGIAFSIVFALITGSDGHNIQVAVGTLTQLSFSRSQEQQADETALLALQRYYGHTCGAQEFFEAIATGANKTSQFVEFLQTHPDTQRRLNTILATQTNCQNQLTPLPEEITRIQSQRPQPSVYN